MAKKKKGNNKKNKAGKSSDAKSEDVVNKQPQDPATVATINEEPADLDRAPVDGTNEEIDHVEALLDRRVLLADTNEGHDEDAVAEDESHVQQRLDEKNENGNDMLVLERDAKSSHEERSKVVESSSDSKPVVDGDVEEVVGKEEIEHKEEQLLPEQENEKTNVDVACLPESKNVAGDLQDVVLEKGTISGEEQPLPHVDDVDSRVDGVNLPDVKPVSSDLQEVVLNEEGVNQGEMITASTSGNVAFEVSNACSGISKSFSDVEGDPTNIHAQRKSSVEMEEVDLMRDEEEVDHTSDNYPTSTTVTSKENEAFGFLVAALRAELGDDARNVSDDTLCQYLCWKPDIKRARDRFIAHQKFFKDNFGQTTLLLSVNPKVCFLLRSGMVLAPEELITKNGSAVMIIRASKCDLSRHGCKDTDAGCAIFFAIQQLLERKSHDVLTGGVAIILDLVGCVRKNVSAKIVKLLSDAAGCFPIRIRAIYVVAMPWWFPSGHKRFFSPKLRERIHFLKDKSALSEYIDEDRLLEDDGGIFCFDLQTWISSTLSAEVGMVSN
jgi:hypothetical protein